MNKKEISELRRHIHPERHNINKIYTCYVNTSGEVISQAEYSTGMMGQNESETYLGILRKVLSGTIGKNLLDIDFPTQDVMNTEQHKLLMELYKTCLEDPDPRGKLLHTIIESLEMDTNYLIVLAADTYDVPYRGKDGEKQADAGTDVFSWFLCAICPVRDESMELRYNASSREFHTALTGQIASPPLLGFMFPCFDDRATNIYNALYYTKNAADIHDELINVLFSTEIPMTAPAQKDAFIDSITESLEKDCSFQIVQSVHDQLRGRIALHKECRSPDNLELSIREVGDMLTECGVEEERVSAFKDELARQFGEYAALNPNNLMDVKKFFIETPEAKISVDPENSYLIETRVIGGRRFILVPADNGVSVNGVNVSIDEE